MRRPSVRAALFLLVVIVGAALATWSGLRDQAGPSTRTTRAAAPAAYVGAGSCASCHGREHELWAGSSHDLAMQVASAETVLGDFEDATFSYFGLTSSFYTAGGNYFVRTDGPDGELHDYEIAYTFGAYPLQQYLIAFPGGRYQALSIAWDSRSQDEGGQRWFHLYPDERIDHDDELHWSGPNQNWNYMCAECHSTDLRKNYDLETDSYGTTWSDIDVACEACHGPGSKHLDWAEAARAGKLNEDGLTGFVFRLRDPAAGIWRFDGASVTASRAEPPASNAQIEMCARCHSRRRVIWQDYVHGRPLLDTHLPRPLAEGLYFADGQILDEVYVYGSFLQSKMYRAGVVCTDCHDPHSLQVRAPGNALCARCHRPAVFDAPSHHFHRPGSAGASCTNCHMPTRKYMVVDARRDHSMRVPRPDLTLEIGTPNACNGCHTDRSPEWAADQVARWYGRERQVEPHFSEALSAGRSGGPGALEALVRLAGDTAQPDIARATALFALRRYPAAAAADEVARALSDDDPLVRVGALSALQSADPASRLRLAYPLLEDPIRAVRVEAVQVLALVPPEMMSPRQLGLLDRTVAEYVASQLANADRPGAHLNIGVLYTERRQFAEAEAAYRTALRLDPSFVEALINLADLYRVQGRDDEGENLLRQALDITPDEAVAHHALALLLVRRGRMPEAIAELREAATLAPEDPRFSYVYAVALKETGQLDEALDVLERAHHRRQNDPEILAALVSLHRDRGDTSAALEYARKLVALSPQDAEARELLKRLEAAAHR